VRIGVVILPEHRWSAARELWRRAEDLGFDHAWTYDHLAWRSLRDTTWFGAIPTLTAAAVVTHRIRLGPLVASPNFRHPVPFAKELISLDDVSGGRLTLGVGAGGEGWDAAVLGEEPWSPRERADRFAEFVDLTDRLLRQPETTYRGRHYAADGARTYPGCVQRPRLPLAVAAAGAKAMGIAARYGDLWVTLGDPKGVRPVSDQLRQVEEACVTIGRDPASLRRLVLTGPRLPSGLSSVEEFRDVVGRYEEIGVTDYVVHWPRATEPYAGDLATFERIFTA